MILLHFKTSQPKFICNQYPYTFTCHGVLKNVHIAILTLINRLNLLPEQEYIAALIEDLHQDLKHFPPRNLRSIFIGGGTPSLFSPQAFDNLLNQLQQVLPFSKDIEITMEANPGTVEQGRFKEYRHLGINRLSLGIQSFNPKHLKALGRIHDEKQAHKAIEAARNAGFNN